MELNSFTHVHPYELLFKELKARKIDIYDFFKWNNKNAYVVLYETHKKECLFKPEYRITMEFAKNIFHATGIPVKFWLNLQHNYDLWILDNE